MDTNNLESFKSLAEKLMSKIHPSIPWEWDERFHSMLIVLTDGQAKDVYPMIRAEFSENWGANSIAQAPATIQYLAEQIFGVRHGQLLFTMNPDLMVVLFAAWWPWSDGNKISLRVGLRTIEGSTITYNEIEALLKKWFNLVK